MRGFVIFCLVKVLWGVVGEFFVGWFLLFMEGLCWVFCYIGIVVLRVFVCDLMVLVCVWMWGGIGRFLFWVGLFWLGVVVGVIGWMFGISRCRFVWYCGCSVDIVCVFVVDWGFLLNVREVILWFGWFVGFFGLV